MTEKEANLLELLDTKTVPPPNSIYIGIRKYSTTHPRPMKEKNTRQKREVYVTVAGKDFSPANGLFIILAESHKHRR